MMEYQHGSYTAHWEDALLQVRQVGDPSVEDVIWICDLMLAQAKRVGPIDVLADLSNLGRVSPEVRRQFSRHSVHKHIRAVAVFGASGVLRAVATLALRAGSLFSKVPVEMAFFGTEAEARAWLHRQRAKQS